MDASCLTFPPSSLSSSPPSPLPLQSSSSSSSSSPPRPLPFQYTPLTPPTHLPINLHSFFPSEIMNHDGAATSSHHHALLENQEHYIMDASWLTLSLPSSSPPPSPPSWSLPPTPLPVDSPPFFYSQQQDYHHQEKEQDVSLSPSNLITNPSKSKMMEESCILPPSSPSMKKKNHRKTAAVKPPFPWATSKRATVHTLDHLLSQLNLKTITGTLQCKSCLTQTDIHFDLLEKFEKLASYIKEKKSEMFQRAPDAWLKPVLPDCKSCGRNNTMQPLIEKKKEINWVFLVLGEMIGCCNVRHLKYFCKHNDLHRTGARNRLIYLTYISLCKQLQPQGPFDP
ncbi:hypothetical protein RYX36_031517 [Vicia faba]